MPAYRQGVFTLFLTNKPKENMTTEKSCLPIGKEFLLYMIYNINIKLTTGHACLSARIKGILLFKVLIPQILFSYLGKLIISRGIRIILNLY